MRRSNFYYNYSPHFITNWLSFYPFSFFWKHIGLGMELRPGVRILVKMSGSHFRNRITVKRPIPWNYNTTKINPSQLLILTLWITIHNFTLEVAAIAFLVFVAPAAIPASLLPSSPHCHRHYHGTTTTIVPPSFFSFFFLFFSLKWSCGQGRTLPTYV